MVLPLLNFFLLQSFCDTFDQWVHASGHMKGIGLHI